MLKDITTFSDFQKLDLRVGKVLKAEKVAGSEKLLRLNIYLGEEYQERQILAGIALWYKPQDLEGKKFIFVANLEAKKMMGEESQGMMLAAEDTGKCLLLPVNKKIPEGTIIR